MEQNVSLVLDGLERLNANDLQGYFELLDEDAVLHSAFVGDHRGKPDVTKAIADGLGALSTHWRRVEKVAAYGDHVVVWLSLGGTFAESGQSVAIEGCTVFEVRDGLVTATHECAGVATEGARPLD